MKVDYTEELQKSSNDGVLQRTKAPAVAGSTVGNANQTGAVFENGVTSKYIEKAEKDGKTALDEQEGSEARQMQEQLAALANTTSEEDLKQLQEEIDNPEDEEINTIITVQDKIKAKMAAYCDGYTGNVELTESELQQIKGLPANAQQLAKKLKEADLPVTRENVENMQFALQMASHFTQMPDSVKASLLKNPEQELTIESLYMAFYSSDQTAMPRTANGAYYSQTQSGYITENTGSVNIEDLREQIVHRILTEGLEANPETIAKAEWLTKNQLPISKETIELAEQIDNLQFPLDEDDLTNQMTSAIADGKPPVKADLLAMQQEKSMSYDEAANLIDNVTDEQIGTALAKTDGDLTLAALKEASDDAVLPEAANFDTLAVLTARRQLEQIRLQMTMEAVGVMEKQGIHIDTQPLQELVRQLEEIEAQFVEKQLAAAGVEVNEQTTQMYHQVNQSLEIIKQAPAAALGVAAFDEGKQNFEAFTKECTTQTQRYQNANQRYETMMTRPNSELGDSIQKAFRNVDDILKDMNLEANDYNRRAVRILGYNQMEITKENISAVKALDISVQRMLQSMTPTTVVKMIRDHYNPLQASVSEINQRLDVYKEQGFVNEERYSEYLWKLERQNGITDEERNSYIGIYRLLNQIEISDGAVIGALYSQGAELTMGNLLSAVRTKKHGAMDYQIDNHFAGVEKKAFNSISNQIEQGFPLQEQNFYKDLAARTLDSLNPHALSEIMEQKSLSDMTLQEFAEEVEKQGENEEAEAAYRQEQLSRMQEIADVDEKVLQLFQDYKLPVSYQYLEAAQEMLFHNGNWAKELQKLFTDEMPETLEELTKQLLSHFDGKEQASASYDAFMKLCMEQAMGAAIEETDTYLDIRSMKLLSSQIYLASDMARQECYQIPLQVGEETVAINLKFVHQKERGQKVSISMQTERFGVISAEFTVKKLKVKGYVQCSQNEGLDMLKQLEKPFARELKVNEGLSLFSLSYVLHQETKTQSVFAENSDDAADETTNAQLYQVAKSFISILQLQK